MRIRLGGVDDGRIKMAERHEEFRIGLTQGELRRGLCLEGVVPLLQSLIPLSQRRVSSGLGFIAFAGDGLILPLRAVLFLSRLIPLSQRRVSSGLGFIALAGDDLILPLRAVPFVSRLVPLPIRASKDGEAVMKF
jgi:hypothetical protein